MTSLTIVAPVIRDVIAKDFFIKRMPGDGRFILIAKEGDDSYKTLCYLDESCPLHGIPISLNRMSESEVEIKCLGAFIKEVKSEEFKMLHEEHNEIFKNSILIGTKEKP